MTKHSRYLGAVLTLAAAPVAAIAQANTGWQFGAVIDITHTSRALELGARDKGLQLGHSDLTASGPLGSLFKAHVGAMFETHDGKLEKSIEEAWVETTRLPAYG